MYSSILMGALFPNRLLGLAYKSWLTGHNPTITLSFFFSFFNKDCRCLYLFILHNKVSIKQYQQYDFHILYTLIYILSMSSHYSYDPEDDRKAKRDNSANKAKRKWLKKSKSTGPAATKRQVVIKQERRTRGETDRSGDPQRRSKKRRCGDIDRSY